MLEHELSKASSDFSLQGTPARLQHQLDQSDGQADDAGGHEPQLPIQPGFQVSQPGVDPGDIALQLRPQRAHIRFEVGSDLTDPGFQGGFQLVQVGLGSVSLACSESGAPMPAFLRRQKSAIVRA